MLSKTFRLFCISFLLGCGGWVAAAQPAVRGSVPHFSHQGKILHRYVPGESLFVRTLFKLRPPVLEETPGLLEQLRQAEVNTLTSDFFLNPADTDTTRFQDWSLQWSTRWKRNLAIAQRAGMPLCLIGDDVARTPEELRAILTSPWAARGLQIALMAARDSHRVIGIEMIDEVNALWGETPKPTDHPWREAHIQDDAFVRLMGIINQVPGRPAITWPVVGWATPSIARAWMGDPEFSDYATHFWYPKPHATLAENARDMIDKIRSRGRLMPPDRPFMVLTKLLGPQYTKKGPGDHYTPGQDELIDGAVSPADVASQIMRAAALGASGVRVYAFDSPIWREERSEGKVEQMCQTGANPITGVGMDRWRAMAAAFRLIKAIEPILLDQRLDAPNWGDAFILAARQGREGRLLMAVSNSDQAVSHAVDLSGYLYPDGKIEQYQLDGEQLTRTSLTAPPQQVTFPSGATYVWVMTP